MKNLTKIAFLTLLLVAASCASHKKTSTTIPVSSYEWLTAKADIDIEEKGSAIEKLSGQLRIRRDSIVWLSVAAAMGMEALRIKVSNDSVWILNRLEKHYLTESIDTLSYQLGLPLSLSLVQTLLLDNNEGFPPVENQTVRLKSPMLGEFCAKIKYKNIKLEDKTSFPLKITDKMERIHLPKTK